jgi:hypothetical protein
MIFDTRLLFSNAQAVTASAASTDFIDLGAMGRVVGATADLPRDAGKGEPVPILVQVVEVFDSVADDETLSVAIQLDSTTTFTPDKTITLGTMTNAQLKTLGFQLPVQYLPDGIDLRYARLFYTVAGSGNFTAGKVTAGIVAGRQTN